VSRYPFSRLLSLC
ncbi:hypothetical protein CP8484711_1292B, partial [Chlamydia psittaci 84-8471/1]